MLEKPFTIIFQNVEKILLNTYIVFLVFIVANVNRTKMNIKKLDFVNNISFHFILLKKSWRDWAKKTESEISGVNKY